MPTEIIRGSDLRIALTHKARTAYGTAIAAVDLTGGKSYRPSAAILPEITRRLAREGNLPFSGHEFALETNEYEVQRDLAFSLNFEGADSFLVAWAAAFALQNVASVQEGVTGHYTHTIKASDPLASGQSFAAKVTDIYFDSGGPDATRRKAILLSLALTKFSISARLGALVQLAMDFLGSGKDDTSTAVTPPALTGEFLMTGQRFKFEIGNQGGALTDFTERVREWAFACDQSVAADAGYTPDIAAAAGKFRSQLRFMDRKFSLDWSMFADRANTDIRDRVFNNTKTEIKITVDSDVVAGTGTKNHGFVIRIPDCRLREAPYDFDDAGAFYRVSVPAAQVYKDPTAGFPCQIVVENATASYLT